jgi:hypothetical protein
MMHPTLINQLTETHIADLRMAAAANYRSRSSRRFLQRPARRASGAAPLATRRITAALRTS